MACKDCGDIDLSPCDPTIPVEPIQYTKCKPCRKATCLQKIDSSCVYYKFNQFNCDQGLTYLDIQNSTPLEDVVEKIDSELNKITKPTLINCFVTESGINLTTYRLNDILLELQKKYCQSLTLNTQSLQTLLETIRDTPSLKTLFCEIIATCE